MIGNIIVYFLYVNKQSNKQSADRKFQRTKLTFSMTYQVYYCKVFENRMPAGVETRLLHVFIVSVKISDS
jgi:hypothetical protein